MRWLNPPPNHDWNSGRLTLVTADATDFWRTTHYDFIHDNGHFCYQDVPGDFTAQVQVCADYRALYDQAGLMIRLDEGRWIKAGIEHTDGLPHFSVVVTNDHSDWSVTPLTAMRATPDAPVRIRMTRRAEAVLVQYAVGEHAPWSMARLAYLSPAPAMIGMMACSPKRAGLAVIFDQFHVGPAIAESLHAGES